MSASNVFETALLQHIFTNNDVATLGDATGIRGSTTAGSLWVSLHTANPGEAGNQTTSESAYTNYARVGVVRSGTGWTVSGAAASNAATVSFPACGATSSAVAYFGIGTSSAGTGGSLLFSGSLAATLNVTNGVTPQFAANVLVITLD